MWYSLSAGHPWNRPCSLSRNVVSSSSSSWCDCYSHIYGYCLLGKSQHTQPVAVSHSIPNPTLCKTLIRFLPLSQVWSSEQQLVTEPRLQANAQCYENNLEQKKKVDVPTITSKINFYRLLRDWPTFKLFCVRLQMPSIIWVAHKLLFNSSSKQQMKWFTCFISVVDTDNGC